MKWYIKNMKLIDGFVMVLAVLALVIAVFKDFYTLFVGLVCGAVLILLAIISNFARKKALKEANDLYESKCNSSESMEIAGSIYRSNPKRTAFAIDYSTVLLNSSLEHYQMVKDALNQMKSSHVPIPSPYMEACFNLGLCRVYLNESNSVLAEDHYRKAYIAYERITNEKETKQIKNQLLICLTELYILKEDIPSAKRELESIDTDTKRRKLEAVYLEARIDLAEGKEAEAKEKLLIVSSQASQIALGQRADKLINIEE